MPVDNCRFAAPIRSVFVMGKKLCDLPLRTLVRMLQATERLAGPESQSVVVLRRAVARKREATRRKAVNDER
jgi:hypothetical protein